MTSRQDAGHPPTARAGRSRRRVAAVLGALLATGRRFAADRRGATAMILSIAAPALFMCASVATQYSMLVLTKEKLQAIADSAALGAAKQLNLSNPYSTSAVDAAVAIAKAELTGADGGTVDDVQAAIVDNNSGIDVTIGRSMPSLFGSLLEKASFTVSAHARAHATGGPPVCAIALDPKVKGAVTMDTSAVVNAKGCEVYSDSKSNYSIVADQSAVLETAYTCAVGGKKGNFPNFSPQPKSGCPFVEDPLASRPQPQVGLLCDHIELSITTSTTLAPGLYCGGLKVSAGAVVNLQPGIYIISGGPLDIEGGAALIGTNVGFFLTKYLLPLPPLEKVLEGPGPATNGPAPGTTIYFAQNSTISLTAPKTGTMAGLLFFEDRTLPTDQLHQILSNNAQTLLGTIYLPQGRLFVGSSAPVSADSAYTVIVSRTLELSAGPTLVLNSNYSATDVPVPPGVGPQNNKVVLVK